VSQSGEWIVFFRSIAKLAYHQHSNPYSLIIPHVQPTTGVDAAHGE